jgi:hypothetical protein
MRVRERPNIAQKEILASANISFTVINWLVACCDQMVDGGSSALPGNYA